MQGGWLLLLGWAITAGPDATEREARALIEKAIQAQGGFDFLGKSVGVRGRFKGSHFDGSDGFHGEYYSLGSGKLRLSLDFKADGRRTFVYNQGKAWMRYEGFTQELDEEFVKRLTRANHVDRVSGLVALVRDKGYTFTLLGESMMDKTPVLGVKVSADGQPDVSLYFDKATGLLRKSAHKMANVADREELHDVIYEEYRLVDLTVTDEKLLAAAGRKTTGPELLAALRAGIPDAARRKEIDTLIAQLGAKSFAARQQATSALMKHGIVAAALLQQTRKVSDVEVARRAENCLERLGAEINLAAATVRLVGARKPAGAVETLLAYAPAAPTETLSREVYSALAAIAEASKEPDPVLVRALSAEDPQVRQAAAAALGKDGGAFLNRPGRRLYPTGLRLPTRTTTYSDGQKRMMLETVEREFFNRLDDGLFARPDQDVPPR